MDTSSAFKDLGHLKKTLTRKDEDERRDPWVQL